MPRIFYAAILVVMKTAAEKITEYTVNELKNGLEAAFIDSSHTASQLYKPSFVSNIPERGEKVLSEIEDLLLSSESYFLSVAFITLDGITPLLETLRELDESGIKGRILTTDYLSFSEPKALDKLSSLSSIDVRMYMTDGDIGLHTKGYIFKRDEVYRIIIGSSNLTAKALTVNREWNMKIVSSENGETALSVLREAEELWNSKNTKPYSAVREDYRLKYKIEKEQRELALKEKPVSYEKYTLQPNSMQVGFINSLKRIMSNNEDRALLISATGTGKTYASAFAMRELGYKKVLFVVHRTQLARQALESYRNVFGENITLSVYGDGEEYKDTDFTFALIQTLSRDLYKFRENTFDAIILDEAHHSASLSYKKILDYFTPQLWLGMTATPDKRDDNIEGRNIYEIFDYQIAYEIRLKEAMEENLLCPFHYFGITDIDLIDDNSKLSPSSFNRLISKERVDRIIEKAEYFGWNGDRVRGLIFTSTIKEAEELSSSFNERGYRTVALSGRNSTAEREDAFERLSGDERPGALDYIFSVEILNEGVDIVEVNQVIMLRPTQSPIVFIQQLGRGLRKARGKEYVVVLDFIGNYNNNFLIPVALSGDRSYNKDTITKYVISGSETIPGSSTIHFDKIAKERIFASINRLSGIKTIIKESYISLKAKLGRRPYLYDFYVYNEVDPILIISEYKSYPAFISHIDKDSSPTLLPKEILILEYLSKTVLSGLRPHETEIISLLLTDPLLTYEEVKEKIRADYGITVDDTSLTSAVSLLEGNFVTNEDEKKKYGGLNILSSDGDDIIRGALYGEIERNEEFRREFDDIIKLSKRRYEDKYHSPDSTFVLYEKYSRRDVSLLINAGKDKSSTMYGKYRHGDDCFLFVTYHKKTGDEGKYLTGKPDYSDYFLDNQIFLWDSQIGKGVESSYMRDVTGAERKHLLVKKSDAESSFYYMGLFDILSVKAGTKNDNNGKPRDIAKVRMKMRECVRDDLLRYLESPIGEENEKS